MCRRSTCGLIRPVAMAVGQTSHHPRDFEAVEGGMAEPCQFERCLDVVGGSHHVFFWLPQSWRGGDT